MYNTYMWIYLCVYIYRLDQLCTQYMKRIILSCGENKTENPTDNLLQDYILMKTWLIFINIKYEDLKGTLKNIMKNL